ncbi:hypothetical protein Dsin_005400 [Dipteronia sinensis]|uniref:BHLH domain-containing protein n=1 Tax=Dipteronia sinensis TaxID=43782 RepID=A0AAE0AWI8_9ROSI|nr:hypothetical protein Dsin_005400 [Dipteronia sinensis]
MELPQSRPFGAEGRKPTHDFLSLYSHSTVQQDPRSTSQGGYLQTHDFLQPLERVGKNSAKEEITVEISSTVEKPPPAAPPPLSSSTSGEHILPGGIGTYSISHISYFNQKIPKSEGTMFTIAQASSTEKNDDNSNCSSYTGSGFTLWEESAGKKGKTGKENAIDRSTSVREAVVKVGQWASQSSSHNHHHQNSFSSLSSSQSVTFIYLFIFLLLIALTGHVNSHDGLNRPLGVKSQSFMEMIKSAKGSIQDDDLLDEDDEFLLKKENSGTTLKVLSGELRVKVDGKNTDQRPNTPRSKHSATEQRRRSKINDRFQMLRDLIPHSDQKRDKASFLLEVIEYIQFLQEKVQKYEGPYVGWNQEPTKLMPWRNNNKPAESYVDQSRGINSGSGPALVYAAKFDEKKIAVSPAIPRTAQNPVDSEMSTATTFKSMDHQPGITNKSMPFPMSLQPNYFTPVRSGGVVAQLPPRLTTSDAENTTSQPQAQLCNIRSCTSDGVVASDKLKEQELTIEGGTINISTAYSQGLLNTLTQALQTSGVDLSQASISVQIDLGKRANGRPVVPASIVKDSEDPSSNQGTTRSRVGSGEDPDQALKKLKTHKS